MSALTKVFIVLHVIMSLLLTAGLIVFVNRVENFQVALAAAQKSEKSHADAAAIARADVDAARGETDRVRAAADTRLKVLQAQLAAARSESRGNAAQIAQRDAEIESLKVALTNATSALDFAQGTVGQQTATLTELRNNRDDIQRRLAEALVTISDLRNRADVATRMVRQLEEDVQATQEENEQLRAAAEQRPDAGGRARPAAGRVGGGGGPIGEPVTRANPDVNGVVRATRVIAGVPYATISIGSKDGVAAKMRFTVTDAAGNDFLGYLTVESVEPDEATGRLEGPKAQAIQKGHRVVQL